MRSVFIADAHLRHPDDDNYGALLEFLESLKGNTDTLYILGDLFEFWIGSGDVVRAFPHYLPLLLKLVELKRGGTGIVYYEGNHDFHLGSFFSDTLRAEVHPGPGEADIDGRRVYISHGDEINRRDWKYRLLRATLHSRGIALLAAVVPAQITAAIAEGMSRLSRTRRKNRPPTDRALLLKRFALAKFAEGFGAVITGHFHFPLVEEDGERTLVALGGWLDDYYYAECNDGEFALLTYSPSPR